MLLLRPTKRWKQIALVLGWSFKDPDWLGRKSRTSCYRQENKCCFSSLRLCWPIMLLWAFKKRTLGFFFFQRQLHFAGLAIRAHVPCHSWSSLSNEMRVHSIILSPFFTYEIFHLAPHFPKATQKFPVTLGKCLCYSSSHFIHRSRKGLWYLHLVPMTPAGWPCLFAFILCFKPQFSVSICSHCRLSLHKNMWVFL